MVKRDLPAGGLWKLTRTTSLWETVVGRGAALLFLDIPRVESVPGTESFLEQSASSLIKSLRASFDLLLDSSA
jgi:hypothetical protein